jgi:hypothetical protein
MSAVLAWLTRHTCVTPASACTSSGSLVLKTAGGLIQLSGL